MKKEEAIEALGLMEHIESIVATYEPGEAKSDTTVCELKAACRMAISALRAQQTPLDRSRWDGCNYCKGVTEKSFKYGFSFCPYCGRPLTEAAWAKLERRINGGKTD